MFASIGRMRAALDSGFFWYELRMNLRMWLIPSRANRLLTPRCIEETRRSINGYYINKAWLTQSQEQQRDVIDVAEEAGFRPSMHLKCWFYPISDDAAVHLKMSGDAVKHFDMHIKVGYKHIDRTVIPYIFRNHKIQYMQHLLVVLSRDLFELRFRMLCDDL